MSKIPDEIKAGMELLDREVPGWREEIDLYSLDMGLCEHCILGQLFREYDEGVRAIGITNEKAEQLGLFISNNKSFPNDKYTALTIAWKEALQVKSE